MTATSCDISRLDQLMAPVAGEYVQPSALFFDAANCGGVPTYSASIDKYTKQTVFRHWGTDTKTLPPPFINGSVYLPPNMQMVIKDANGKSSIYPATPGTTGYYGIGISISNIISIDLTYTNQDWQNFLYSCATNSASAAPKLDGNLGISQCGTYAGRTPESDAFMQKICTPACSRWDYAGKCGSSATAADAKGCIATEQGKCYDNCYNRAAAAAGLVYNGDGDALKSQLPADVLVELTDCLTNYCDPFGNCRNPLGDGLSPMCNYYDRANAFNIKALSASGNMNSFPCMQLCPTVGSGQTYIPSETTPDCSGCGGQVVNCNVIVGSGNSVIDSDGNKIDTTTGAISQHCGIDNGSDSNGSDSNNDAQYGLWVLLLLLIVVFIAVSGMIFKYRKDIGEYITKLFAHV